MHTDEFAWIARAAVEFDCLVFVWRGRNGPQVVLMPWSIAHGASKVRAD